MSEAAQGVGRDDNFEATSLSVDWSSLGLSPVGSSSVGREPRNMKAVEVLKEQDKKVKELNDIRAPMGLTGVFDETIELVDIDSGDELEFPSWSRHNGAISNSSATTGPDMSTTSLDKGATSTRKHDLFATNANLASTISSEEIYMASVRDGQIADLFAIAPGNSVPVFEATDFGKLSRESSVEVPALALSSLEEVVTEAAVFPEGSDASLEKLSGDLLDLASAEPQDGEECFAKALAPGQIRDEEKGLDHGGGASYSVAKWSPGVNGITEDGDEGFGQGSSKKEQDNEGKGCAGLTEMSTGAGSVMKTSLLQEFESVNGKVRETLTVGGGKVDVTSESGGANLPGNCHVRGDCSLQDDEMLLSDDKLNDTSTLFDLEMTKPEAEESSNGLPMVDPVTVADREVITVVETRDLECDDQRAVADIMNKTVTKQFYKTPSRTGGVAEKKDSVGMRDCSVAPVALCLPGMPRIGKISSISTYGSRPRPQKAEPMRDESTVARSKTGGLRTRKGLKLLSSSKLPSSATSRLPKVSRLPATSKFPATGGSKLPATNMMSSRLPTSLSTKPQAKKFEGRKVGGLSAPLIQTRSTLLPKPGKSAATQSNSSSRLIRPTSHRGPLSVVENNNLTKPTQKQTSVATKPSGLSFHADSSNSPKQQNLNSSSSHWQSSKTITREVPLDNLSEGVCNAPDVSPNCGRGNCTPAIITTSTPSLGSRLPIASNVLGQTQIISKPLNMTFCKNDVALLPPKFSPSKTEEVKEELSRTVTKTKPTLPQDSATPVSTVTRGEKKRKSLIPTPQKQVTPDRGGVHHAKKRLPMNDHGNDMSPQLSDDPIVSRPSYGRPFTANGSNSQKKGPRRHAGLGSKPLKARNGGCGFSYRESKKLSSKKVQPPVATYEEEFGGQENDVPPPPKHTLVHSPLNKDDVSKTPHSKWSPIKKTQPVMDSCYRCTKVSHIRQ